MLRETRSSRWRTLLWLPPLLTLFVLTGPAWSQKKENDKPKATSKKESPSLRIAEQVLKTPPRPKKDALPASKLPLEFVVGERIALVGNSTGERMNLFGNFEAALHQNMASKQLVVRNFCRPADEVSIRQRAGDYTKLDDPLFAFNPDTFVCFFGFNESYAGKEAVAKYKDDYKNFIAEYTKRYPRDDAGSPARFVLISPAAFENTGDPLLPDGREINENLALYAAATAEVARELNLAYVDIFTATKQSFGAAIGKNFTVNGFHVNAAGDRVIAEALYRGLFGTVPNLGGPVFDKIRTVVNSKSWVHLQDYRMLNGWYVYGGRRTWDTETFPLEYKKIRNMAAVRDQLIWDLAAGKTTATEPDDSQTGELFTPPTRFGAPDQKGKSETELFYLSPAELIKSCTVPDGFEVRQFADEKDFPAIAKPVQMNFDSKGRLWISTMPSYPQWKPGDPPPQDKLVILEDTDGDGKADKHTVFYDKLHCPTGFEFYQDGVIVVDQPRLIFLRDTNGDDVADEVTQLLDGWASDDTHHTVGAFEWSHGQYLRMLEGVAMSTTVETPWGPLRNYGSSGSYTLDPKTLRLSHFVTPGYGNPWCYVFNDWGQGFCGDGTGAAQHWDTLLSGAQYTGRRGAQALFNTEGMRPVVGSEFLRTRQFPDEVHGHFIYACVINMNGLTRFEVNEDGSGYSGARLKKDGKPFDLLSSTHKHFRPVDPIVGPDGAIWFGDWANALIGHMQYSQRDPNRDHSLGRIYRLVYTKKPLLKPVLQHGKSIAELLDQLKEYENRTRYRARRELWARPQANVVAGVNAWVGQLDAADPQSEYDKLLCEAMWVLQGHRVVNENLIKKILAGKSENARAAAIKVITDERLRFPPALEYLKKYAVDESPRVRIEALRGLSFFRTPDATDAVIAAAKLPTDKWLDYMLISTLGATESSWSGRYLAKQIGQDDKKLSAIFEDIIKSSKTIGAAVPYLKTLLGSKEASAEERNKAIAALAAMNGNAEKGKAVFRNSACLSCHKWGGEGQEYGPDLTKIAQRLNKVKLIESIIDPNAELNEKYLTTHIVKADGKTVQGLLVSETDKEVVIFDGKQKQYVAQSDIDERNVLKQSSMPEGLAGSMAPNEFLDLIEFLNSLK